MDELIRDIAKRMWAIHPRDIDAMGLKTRIDYYEHELRSFAKDVAAESVAEISKQIAGSVHTAASPYNKGVDAGRQAIKKRFGLDQ